jgi:hypothetical protein
VSAEGYHNAVLPGGVLNSLFKRWFRPKDVSRQPTSCVYPLWVIFMPFEIPFHAFWVVVHRVIRITHRTEMDSFV